MTMPVRHAHAAMTKRALENVTAASLDHLVRVLKRKLKKIQYRPRLLYGCLTETRPDHRSIMIEPTAITS